MPTKAIGRELGVSKNAVIGRAKRMGLTPRPSPLAKCLHKLPQSSKVLVTLKNIAPNGCLWPTGHPGEDGFHLCGEPKANGRPYCPDHCKRAYTKINPDRFNPGPTSIFFGGRHDVN